MSESKPAQVLQLEPAKELVFQGGNFLEVASYAVCASGIPVTLFYAIWFYVMVSNFSRNIFAEYSRCFY